MLGSVHDADDALQDTLLRAWRGAAGLRDVSSARSWLYTIATNVCLSEIERRKKRMLPHDFAPAAAEHTVPGSPEVESTWVEPYPSAAVSYEQREGLELAFVAAAQHLPGTQRAVLILRDVMGFSASETATMLQTSLASVNSALMRSRAAVRERIGPQTQQNSLRALGDGGLRRLVDRYVDAWERCDVDAFTALLVADATFAMPPLATWYTPRQTIATWAREMSLSGAWRWKAVLTEANAQPALGFYAWDEATRAYLPFALNVLSIRDGLVCDVTAFIVRAIGAPESDAYERFPEQPMNRIQFTIAFERFELPERIA